MAERISVGLVGAGWVAEHGYVPALRKSRFRPAAVYDPDPSRAARIAEMLGTDVALSLEACVSKSGRAVILCSPPHVHADQIRLCLSAGRFVLCEKPVLREARELREIRAARRRHEPADGERDDAAET